MQDSEPTVTLCVDCLIHEENVEATMTDDQNGNPLCEECHGARIEYWNERAWNAHYDHQPLYDDRGI